MSEVDRPIKPDPKYIEEYLQRINQVTVKPFLKKKVSSTLPCNTHKQIHPPSESVEKRKEKSKAEVYEEIKQKNLEKFGDRKIKHIIEQENVKKIDPKKMTVDYKPKPVIDTEEYKKKDYVPRPKTAHTLPENNEKVQYEKLIDYFNKELKQLQSEKEQFNKVAEKLKFKESIRNEEGLFYSKVRNEVVRQMAMTQQSHKDDQNAQPKTVNQSREVQKPEKNEQLCKTYSAGVIRSRLDKTCEQMQLLKTQMMHQTLEVQEHRYEVFQVHLLPAFSPQAIYDYIDLVTLRYNANSLYKAAMKAFNSKFQKENKAENAEEVGQEERHGIRQKFVGEKRVSKYEGWTEVWTPGKQRLMSNGQGYKVVWLSNGDVLQEFSNEIKTYFSKTKEMLKVEYKSFPPIYYHEELKQIWRYMSDGSREIVFSNGRLDTIPATPSRY